MIFVAPEPRLQAAFTIGGMESHRRPIEGKRIAIQVLSRRDVKHLNPDVPHVVISIADAAAIHPTLADSPTRLGLLRLAFDDVEPKRKEYYGSKRAMTVDDARQIRAFVEAHLDVAELIVVHCDAGMCRSPAVAAALWRWLENGRGPFFETFRPNAHVFRTMSDELH